MAVEQEVWTQDRVIGRNLRHLRDEREDLTQEKFVEALEWSLGIKWTDSKWSRMETGNHKFTVTELLVLGRFFAISPIRLLQPPRNVTHVKVGPFVIPRQRYMADLFYDPQGRDEGVPVKDRMATSQLLDLREHRARLGNDGYDDLNLGDAVGLKEHHERVKWYMANVAAKTPEEMERAFPVKEHNEAVRRRFEKGTEDGVD